MLDAFVGARDLFERKRFGDNSHFAGRSDLQGFVQVFAAAGTTAAFMILAWNSGLCGFLITNRAFVSHKSVLEFGSA
jgi:hypothetical protein